MFHVIWHKNPDTDAICASLVAAEYFNEIGQEATAYRLGELNRETEFVLKNIGVQAPIMVSTLEPGSDVVLVDHNAPTQSIDHLDTLRVRSIIDHHLVENLATKEPIQLRFDPICSTCSILFLMFVEQDLEMSDQTAKLILAGILSDSLAFKSPTTTAEDREIAEYLAEDLGIDDIQAYARAMFDAKSDLGDMPIRKIIELDYKVYTAGDKKFGYWVMETTNPQYALGRKNEIVSDLRALKEETGVDAIFFSVVDIIAEKNTVFAASDIEASAVKAAFGVEVHDFTADIGKLLSRKKELEPAVRKFFETK